MLPVSLLVSFLPIPAPDAEMLRVSASRIAPLHSQPWLIALHGLVIAPLWEEFVYRGLILQMLRRYCPLWVAVLVPTFIFAGIHFTFSYQNAVQAALVGLFFAWLAIRSRSLLTNVLCHAGVNLGALFVWRPMVIAQGWTAKADLLHPLSLALIAGSLIGLIVATRALRTEFKSRAATLAAPSSLQLAAA